MIRITHTQNSTGQLWRKRKAKNKPTRWGRFKGWTNRAHFSGFWMESQAKHNCFCCIRFKSHFNFSSQKERVKYWFGSIVCPLSELLLKQLNAQTTEMMDAGPIVAILCRQSMCFPKIRFLWQDFFSLSHNTKLFFWSKKIYLVLAVEEISEAEFYFKEVHKPEE